MKAVYSREFPLENTEFFNIAANICKLPYLEVLGSVNARATPCFPIAFEQKYYGCVCVDSKMCVCVCVWLVVLVVLCVVVLVVLVVQ